MQAVICNPKIRNVHMVLPVGAVSKTGLGIFNIPVFLMCLCDLPAKSEFLLEQLWWCGLQDVVGEGELDSARASQCRCLARRGGSSDSG